MIEYNEKNKLLRYFLPPLDIYLNKKDLIEINSVEPMYLILDFGYKKEKIFDKSLTAAYWLRLCKILSNIHQLQWGASPKRLACCLPGGHRIEAMIGKNVEKEISISIRCLKKNDKTLKNFLATDYQIQFLEEKLSKGLNIVVSGGTSCGKTTFVNTLLNLLPYETRALILEDTREIAMSHDSYSAYYTIPYDKQYSSIDYTNMINHFVRSRPDYIVFGEVSVATTLPMIRLLNSGHQGFITTVHANSPELVPDALNTNALLSGLSGYAVNKIIEKCVDCIIHLEKDDMKKKIDKIYLMKKSVFI